MPRSFAWVIAGVVALAIAFALGGMRNGPSFHVGRADVTAAGGGSITTDDWTYGLPSDVAWTGRDGRWRDHGQPDCLPPGAIVNDLRFAAVEVNVEGTTWRQVLFVDCRSVPS
jgi:hypothetical protein